MNGVEFIVQPSQSRRVGTVDVEVVRETEIFREPRVQLEEEDFLLGIYPLAKTALYLFEVSPAQC